MFLCFYFFYNKKYKFHLNILLSIFITSLYLSFGIDEMQLSSYISLAGIMGEIFLSAFLIICFYFNLTAKFRWDFWRFIFLFFGTSCFTNTTIQWYKIKNNLQALPMGSAMSAEGARDMSGDLNQLILAGWSEAHIIAMYMLTLWNRINHIITMYMLTHQIIYNELYYYKVHADLLDDMQLSILL